MQRKYTIRTDQVQAQYASRDSRLEGCLMPTGVVKSYEPHTGYGFIIPDEGGSDVFVHAKAVERAGIWILTVGQRLSYDLRPRKKKGGRCSAENLREIT
jgi:cold shock protein